MASNTVKDALLEGLKDLDGTTDPATPPADGGEGTPAPAGEATPPDPAAPNADGEGTPDPNDPSTAPPATTPGDEVPKSYFEVDMEDLPPEARAKVIEAVKGRDDFIQKLLRDKAAPVEAGATPPADPPAPAGDPEDLSDKEILETLGLDPEFETPETKAIVALARMNVALHEQVNTVSEKSQLNETERYWETSLTALENQYGTLPPGVTHDDVLREAANAKIAEPMDAYWRIMGPGRAAVLAEVTKRRAEMAESLKKGTQSQKRPSGEADTSEKIIDAKDSKSAVKMAFAQLVKEQGLALPEYGEDD